MAEPRGWLLTLYPHPDHMRLLIKRRDGKHELISVPYRPAFYCVCKEPERITHILTQHPLVRETSIEQKRASVMDLSPRDVVRIEVFRRSDIELVYKDLLKIDGVERCAQRTFQPEFSFIIENNLHFFAAYPGGGPLEGLELRMAAIEPLAHGKVRVKIEGKEPVDLSVRALSAYLTDQAIDVLFSWNGDKWMGKWDIYGKWETGAHIIEQTVHVDVRSDLKCDIYSEGDSRWKHPDLEKMIVFGRKRLSRIRELCELTRMRPDIASRITPGRLNTFLHARVAMERGILIPDDKALYERPKSLQLLGSLDRGGLIFYPRPGVYSNVAKCDFSSMYPSLIVNENISPETMQCRCGGPGKTVPSTGWRICSSHQGVIPAGLQEVLRRRLELKHAMKAEPDIDKKDDLNRRQKALKNILVTCFGYLGYNHFVFSNVEAKEAVMLFGRLAMERTHAIAQECGLDVVYGIVDSIFVSGGTEDDYRHFSKRVGADIGIELSLEGVFDCIVFPPTRQGGGAGSRYWGRMRGGGIECRGIACRRADCPEFLFQFQQEAMERAMKPGAGSPDWGEMEKAKAEFEEQLQAGHFGLEDLAITMDLSKPLAKYTSHAPHIVAAKESYGNEGEHDDIRFVYTGGGPKSVQRANLDSIDKTKYRELLNRSMIELIHY